MKDSPEGSQATFGKMSLFLIWYTNAPTGHATPMEPTVVFSGFGYLRTGANEY
jgi:hypothetical protein